MEKRADRFPLEGEVVIRWREVRDPEGRPLGGIRNVYSKPTMDTGEIAELLMDLVQELRDEETIERE